MPSEQSAVQILDFYEKLKKQQNQKERVYTKIKLEHKINAFYKYQKELENLVKIELGNFDILKSNNNENRLIKVIKGINERLVQIEENVKELNEPFLLFIIGMGNYGKSTLLNGLLGNRVAEMDILPKTWKIDIFYGSDNEKVQVHYKSGQVNELDIEGVKKLLGEEEIKRQNSEDAIYKKLKEKKKDLKTIEEREEYSRYLREKDLYQSQITEVRWPLPKNELLNNFRLVDTPGLSQNLLGDIKLSLNDYYHKADGVLWLLDGNKISAQKSKELIDELNKSLNEVGGKTDNIIAVLNFMDKIRNREGQEAVDRIVNEAREIYGDIFKDIIPISAKEALDGKENKDLELIKKSGINDLMNAISNKFLGKANEVQINSKLQGIKGISNAILKELIEYENLLNDDEEKRKKLKEDFENEIKDNKEKFDSNINQFLTAYRSKVENNILTNTNDLFNENIDREKYIEENIYEMQDVTSEVAKIVDNVMFNVKRCNERYSKISMFKEYKYITLDLDKTISTMQIKEINAPKFSSFEFDTKIGIDFLDSFDFVRGVMQIFRSNKIKKSLKSSLNSTITSLRQQTKEEINNFTKTISENIDSIREESFKVLYCNSRFVESQLLLIKDLKIDLNKEITKNDIYEYITGKVKVEE